LPATGKESKLGRSPIVHSISTTGTVRFDDRAVYRQGHTGGGSSTSRTTKQGFQFLHTHHLCPPVNHRMTVWANRAQIRNRVNLVFLRDLGKSLEVMNVNEFSTEVTVNLFKVEAACDA
jgi:predicted Zn-dependent protease